MSSSWGISVDLSLIIHKGSISSLHCYTVWSLVGTIPTCPGHLWSAVSIIHSPPPQSLLSFFSLYFHHSCSLSPFSHPHLSLSWGKSQVFPLLPIWLHISPYTVANKYPFFFYPVGKPLFSTTSTTSVCVCFKGMKYSHPSLHYVQLHQIRESWASSFSRNWIRSEDISAFPQISIKFSKQIISHCCLRGNLSKGKVIGMNNSGKKI